MQSYDSESDLQWVPPGYTFHSGKATNKIFFLYAYVYPFYCQITVPKEACSLGKTHPTQRISVLALKY